MNKFEDFVGQKFGRLTVVSYSHKERNKNGIGYTHYYNCICDCGNSCIKSRTALQTGTKSCGCLHKETMANINKSNCKHDGDSHNEYARLHRIWGVMHNRCESNYNKSKKYYKDKGITVCDEWKEYIPFKEWALQNGYNDNLTIDRIDSNKDYAPDNCRWITIKEQQNNKKNNKLLEYKGETHTLAEWCEKLDLNYARVKARINSCNWTIEQAFELEKQNLRRKLNK